MRDLPNVRSAAGLLLAGMALFSVGLSVVAVLRPNGALRATVIVLAVVSIAAAGAASAWLVRGGWLRSDGPAGQADEPGKELDG